MILINFHPTTVYENLWACCQSATLSQRYYAIQLIVLLCHAIFKESSLQLPSAATAESRQTINTVLLSIMSRSYPHNTFPHFLKSPATFNVGIITFTTMTPLWPLIVFSSVWRHPSWKFYHCGRTYCDLNALICEFTGCFSVIPNFKVEKLLNLDPIGTRMRFSETRILGKFFRFVHLITSTR